MTAKTEGYDLNVEFGAISTNMVVTEPTEQDAPEFDRFEALAAKLVHVPKSELDDKLRNS